MANGQGFVHAEPFNRVFTALRSSRTSQTLKSLPLGRLDPSPSEVAGIIPLPLSTFASADLDRRRDLHFFRMDPRKPYWTYKCGDLVLRPDSNDSRRFGLSDSKSLTNEDESSHIEEARQGNGGWTILGPQRPDTAILWGLSGWLLHRFLRTMNWTSDPVLGEEE